MISECLQNGQRYHKRQVHNIIFSFLEIFELLRLKTTNKQFKQWVREYFEHLPFLDLSPYFGYTITEQRLLDRSFSNGRSFFQVFQELCPHRTNLSLAYSTQLTCSALKHFLLPDNWSEKLVGLNLYYCTKLKRVDLADVLCDFATTLTDLNLSMIHKLSITGVQRILHRLTELRRISILGSFKLNHHSEQELIALEEIEGCIHEKNYENLTFLDCRKCTLLQDREFWMPINKEESNHRAIFGVYQRGRTWILGPQNITLRDISQLQCLYSDCGIANSKKAEICKSCQRRLFLADFLKKPSTLYLEAIS